MHTFNDEYKFTICISIGGFDFLYFSARIQFRFIWNVKENHTRFWWRCCRLRCRRRSNRSTYGLIVWIEGQKRIKHIWNIYLKTIKCNIIFFYDWFNNSWFDDTKTKLFIFAYNERNFQKNKKPSVILWKVRKSSF